MHILTYGRKLKGRVILGEKNVHFTDDWWGESFFLINMHNKILCDKESEIEDNNFFCPFSDEL